VLNAEAQLRAFFDPFVVRWSNGEKVARCRCGERPKQGSGSGLLTAWESKPHAAQCELSSRGVTVDHLQPSKSSFSSARLYGVCVYVWLGRASRLSFK
jgi:hypothetical protein